MTMCGQNGARVRLIKLRESRGLTKAYIAENVLDVSADQYTKIEAGSRGITTENAIKLADFYGVSCDYILRGVDYHNVDVWKSTGLKNESIAMLIAHKDFELDALFGNGHFWEMMERITEYKAVDIEKEWDFNAYLSHKHLNKLLISLSEHRD